MIAKNNSSSLYYEYLRATVKRQHIKNKTQLFFLKHD